jgi:hypothetical protein
LVPGGKKIAAAQAFMEMPVKQFLQDAPPGGISAEIAKT